MWEGPFGGSGSGKGSGRTTVYTVHSLISQGGLRGPEARAIFLILLAPFSDDFYCFSPL